MAPKAIIKKENKSSAKKDDSYDSNPNVIPWPDLPRQLLYFMARQKDLMLENLGWRGVSKSWRQCGRCSRSRQTSAASKQRWFQLSRSDHDDDDDDPRPHVLSIPYLPGFYVWNRRRLQLLKKQGYEYWMHFRGCSNGWIVRENEEQSWCRYTLSAPLWLWRTLPTWDSKFPFKFATVSKNGVMVLTGTARPAFLIYNYRTHSSGWLPYDSTLIDPYSSEQTTNLMIFTNAVGFKDKYYALSLQGALAVIEEETVFNNNKDSQIRFKITGLGKNRAVPSASSSSRRFVEYLIESDGEIVLAFLISRTKKSEFDDVEVYRLDFGRELQWVKMESLGERALFLGSNCCMCVVNAAEVGCRANCVYFTHRSLKGGCWKEFDMRTGSLVYSTMF